MKKLRLAVGLFTAACLVSAVALAAGEWVTVPLFDGRSTKGWVESGGDWSVRSGWVSGLHKAGVPPVLNFGETLPAEFDLTMLACNTGGYLSILLKDSSQATPSAPEGKSYEFGLGWIQNTRLIIVEGELTPSSRIRRLHVKVPFSWMPRAIHRLNWTVRASGIDFAIDGTSVCRIPGPISSTTAWHLTLQSHAARDTVIAFSAIEVRVPPEEAERIRSAVQGTTERP